jgi:hypothetical protein
LLSVGWGAPSLGTVFILVKVFTAEFFASGHAAFGVVEDDNQTGDAPGNNRLLDQWRI